MNDDQVVFIGSVDYAHHEDGRESPVWCKLRPEFERLGNLWVHVDPKSAKFGEDGTVFWPQPQAKASQGSTWRFEVEDQPRRDGLKVHGSPTSIIEFCALGSGLKEGEARTKLASGSLTIPITPVGPVLLKLKGEGDRWLGPLDWASETQTTGHRIARLAFTGQFSPIHAGVSEKIQTLTLHSRRTQILKPIEQLGTEIDLLCTEKFGVLLSRVADAIKDTDFRVDGAIEISRAVLERYGAWIEDSGLTGKDRRQARAREKAVAAELDEVTEELADRTRLAEAILALPVIENRIEAAVEAAVEAQIADSQDQIAEKLESRRSELVDAEDRLQSLGEKKIALEAELAELEENKLDIDRRIHESGADLESKMRELIDESLSNPIELLARNALVRVLADGVSGRSASWSTGAPSIYPPTADQAEVLDELEGVRNRLHQVSLATAIASEPLLVGTAFALVGKVPLFIGPQALRAAEHTARTVAANQTWIAPVPTSIFGPADLMRIPASRLLRGDAQSMAVGDLLRLARNEKAPIVLLLTNVNRAPFEAAFSELLDCMLSDDCARPIPWTRGFEERHLPAAATIPPNLLVMGTLSPNAPTLFALPNWLRAKVAIVDTDRISAPLPDSIKQRPRSPDPSFLSLSTLYEWRETLFAETQEYHQGRPASATNTEAARQYTAEYRAVERLLVESDSAAVEWFFASLEGLAEETIEAACHSVGLAGPPSIVDESLLAVSRRIKNCLESDSR